MASNSACEYSSLSSHFAALVSARMESEGREKEGIRLFFILENAQTFCLDQLNI